MLRAITLAIPFLAFGPLTSGATAQDSAPIPMDGRTVEMSEGTPVDGLSGSNLPGVGMDVGTGQANSPRGAGGLQNGIGAYGTMAPDTSGTAGNATTRVPGAIPNTNSGVGIPLSTQGEPVN